MSLKDKPQNNKKRIFRAKFFLYDFVKVTAAIPAYIWIKPRISYENENAKKKLKGGAIIISNHTGITDPVKLHWAFWYRRMYMLAFKELFDNKLRKFFFSRVLCLPVDRENFSMNIFNTIKDVTAEGYPVGIYPEGRITHSENGLGDFKGGAMMMALRCGVPIVPVYCAPYRGFFSFSDIIIGEPIDVKELCGAIPSLAAIEKASETVREHELKLIEIYNNKSNERKNK